MTNTKKGRFKGEPMNLIQGHQGRYKRRPMVEPNPGGKCLCNCGQQVSLAPHSNANHNMVKGHPYRFVKGHWLRVPGNARRIRLQRNQHPQPPKVRQLCLGCFIPRPLIAFLDGTPHCIVCVARKRRQQAIDQQHQDQERERKRRQRDGGARAQATRDRNGFRPTSALWRSL
jgi:hypothetical protein